MTAATTFVLVLVGDDAPAIAPLLARQLNGPAVAIPYDALARDWPVNPGDPAALRALTAQQAKLLCAGYVKAGYHVLLAGSFADGLGVEDGSIDGLLRLMATVPGVHADRFDLDPADLDPDTLEAEARAIFERLPREPA